VRTLSIDCATEACSVGLLDGTELVAGDYRILGRGHAEHLIPMIAALPGRGRAERIAVARGPGSFTGIRVGLAAARALALAWGADLVGYSTLALVAAMARREGRGPVAVAMTGGHGQWFVAAYGANGKVVRDCASLSPAAAAAATPEAIIVGSQAEALVAARGHGRALALWPDARQVMLLGAAGLSAATSPIYGRPPDAKVAAAPTRTAQ
jgi:tRNA threonylcarbamoyladenosine biosynthesis protein TsaB